MSSHRAIWQKTNTGETLIKTLQGPPGPQGPQGPQGPAGTPGSGAAPKVMSRRNSNDVSLPNTQDVAVIFDSLYTEVSEGSTGISYGGTFFTNTSGTTLILFVTYHVEFSPNPNGARASYILFNNDPFRRFGQNITQAPSDFTDQTGTAILKMQPGDFFQLFMWHNAGTTLSARSLFCQLQIAVL
jgi:hypothetical protein